MLAGPPGLLEHGPGFSLEDLLPSFAQSTVCWCIMFFIISYHFFVSLSLTHSHLPQCWTAYNRACWLKENVSAFINNSTECQCAHCAYSVTSSILESFTCRITWRSAAFCMFYVGVCVHAVYSGVFNLLLLSSFFMGVLAIDCAVLQERQIDSHSWSVSLSLFLPSFSSLPLFLFCLGGMATAGQTSRQGYAWGSPMQLADSEVQ